MVSQSTFLESTDFTGGAYSFILQPVEQQTTISIPIGFTDDITVEQSEEQFSVSLSVSLRLE